MMRLSVSRKLAETVVQPSNFTAVQCLYTARRHASTDTQGQPATATLSPRWLSDVKTRIGACMTFGLQPHQTREACKILQAITQDWRELLAGSEGFLTSSTRRGLYRHRVVWGEMDAMGHVNNVLYNRYAESGRIEWAQKYAKYVDPDNATAWNELLTPKGDGLILRKITTEFKFPMKYPDHITVYHKLGNEPQPGGDTLLLEVLILSELHQRIVARLYEDCVLYDYRIGKKTSFKPFMVDVFQETWRLQEEAKAVNSERLRDLLQRVRSLETQSWDREDAVEDIGSANR